MQKNIYLVRTSNKKPMLNRIFLIAAEEEPTLESVRESINEPFIESISAEMVEELTPEIQEKVAVNNAYRALKAMDATKGYEDDVDTRMRDLLTDLMHLADVRGMDITDLIDRSSTVYQEEFDE